MVSIRILYHKNTQRVPPTGLTFSNYRSLFAGSAAQRSIAPTPTCFPIPGQVIAHRAHKTRAAKRRNTQNKNNNCPHVVSTLLLYIRGLENQKNKTKMKLFLRKHGNLLARVQVPRKRATSFTPVQNDKKTTKKYYNEGENHIFFLPITACLLTM